MVSATIDDCLKDLEKAQADLDAERATKDIGRLKSARADVLAAENRLKECSAYVGALGMPGAELALSQSKKRPLEK